jgi:C_GCAxxG_C_C family probable redox protein
MDKSEQAAACFKSGFSCSQAVFSTFAVDMGMDRETALRIAGAFGGGIAGRAETCGAITGALMAIGLKYGKIKADDNAAREKTYALASDLIRRFEDEHGSIICRGLLGFDIHDPVDYKAASEAGVFRASCPIFVRGAARFLEEILESPF